MRLNAVHVHGVNDMSTQDVFDYFAEFAPTAVEWIDDSSCMSASLSLSVLYSAAASHIRPSPSQSYFMWRWSLEIEWTVDFHENQTRCSDADKKNKIIRTQEISFKFRNSALLTMGQGEKVDRLFICRQGSRRIGSRLVAHRLPWK